MQQARGTQNLMCLHNSLLTLYISVSRVRWLSTRLPTTDKCGTY